MHRGEVFDSAFHFDLFNSPIHPAASKEALTADASQA